MSKETKVKELDLIEDDQEVQLQDEDLEENVEVENEGIVLEDANVEGATTPKTKAGMINAMYKEMSKMSKSDIMAAYNKFMESDDEDCDEDEDEEEMKETKGKVKESYNFKADLDALVASDKSLSEGFQEKAIVIFEAAVKSKVNEEIDRLEAEYTQSLKEETADIHSELVEKVDGYLNYVVENWMEENRIAVDNGLRAEITESFMEALKGVFTEHYIDVPDSKIDMVDELANQVENLEEQLTKTVEDNIRLNESVEEFRRLKILSEASKDLAVTEAEKLKSLAEDLDFENEAIFAKKVATLKESYFAKPVTESIEEAEIATNANGEEIEVSPLMEKYLAALTKSVK